MRTAPGLIAQFALHFRVRGVWGRGCLLAPPSSILTKSEGKDPHKRTAPGLIAQFALHFRVRGVWGRGFLAPPSSNFTKSRRCGSACADSSGLNSSVCFSGLGLSPEQSAEADNSGLRTWLRFQNMILGGFVGFWWH